MIFEKPEEVFEKLESKFTSGNSVPVERSAITKKEWEAIKEYVNILENAIKGNNRRPQ